jgi:hypothetical protein
MDAILKCSFDWCRVSLFPIRRGRIFLFLGTP